MLHPPTETPSRDARPPRRPGAVVLPVAALAAVLALSVAVTAGGGTADGAAHATATTPGPAVPDAASAARDTAGTSARPSGTPSAASAGTPSHQPTRSARPATTPGADHDRPTHPAAPRTPAPAASAPGTTSPRPRTTAARRTPAAPAPRPYGVLRVGDCFDIDRDAPGTVVPRACDTPHDAELVARLPLTGRYADDDAVRDAAAALCRAPLRAKAALQPLGTRWTTFVQYPYHTSYLLGEDMIACSLAALSGSGRKLTTRLR